MAVSARAANDTESPIANANALPVETPSFMVASLLPDDNAESVHVKEGRKIAVQASAMTRPRFQLLYRNQRI
jgi:hypothetical protein